MTLSEIQEIVSHNFKYEKEVTLDTKLTDITGDSLEFLALMFHIEEKYNIDLELEFFEDVETVKDLIDKMEKNHFRGFTKQPRMIYTNRTPTRNNELP